MKYLILIAALFSQFALASSYYSEDERAQISNRKLVNSDLKNYLHSVTQKGHFEITYREARWELYTNIYLEKNDKGILFIKDLYCEKIITRNVSPNSLPRGSKTNIEHTWPQSKFSPDFYKPLQKSDLHHLFIVSSKANHLRGHYNFGEVTSYYNKTGRCENAGLGVLAKTPVNVAWSSQDFYEPPASHRGNIARALFYFSVRYNLKINDTQEYFLKKWHREDPVERIDQIRNDRIMNAQGNRNPFIDFPDLVDRIKNF